MLLLEKATTHAHEPAILIPSDMTAYHSATFDPHIADQWHLDVPRDGEGNEIRGYHFTSGHPYSSTRPVKVSIYQDGRPLELSFNSEKVVVVSSRARKAVEAVAPKDCQFFDVAIPRMTQPWYILNAIHLVDCFDEAKSRFDLAPSETGRRYAIVTKLIIDPAPLRGQQLFRVRNWDVNLIVSDAVKAAIEGIPSHGVWFKQVTP
jgi:Immunity protein family (Imm11)